MSFKIICILITVSLFASGQSMQRSKIQESIQKNYRELESLYKNLHQHPELSQQEAQTSEIIATSLEKFGFEVFQRIGGYGVAAVLKNGDGPVVLIRTDMDALPVEEKTSLAFASLVKATNTSGVEVPVMHACGHDIHMTVFIGTARALVENKKNWKGTLLLIAQPSEENGLGARAMLNDGLYDKVPYPDFAIALHNHAGMKAGTVGYSIGPFMASVDMMDITVFGKGGHGAAPHQAIDPIVLASQMVLAFQTIVSREINPLEPAVITVGSFHGGTSYNIIPDQVKLQLTLRSYSDDVRKQVIASIQNKAKALAMQAGLSSDQMPAVTYNDSAPPTLNDKAVTERVVSVFNEIFGKENVMSMAPSMVGEDFSRFATFKQHIPYSMFWLGTVDPQVFDDARSTGKTLPPLHSSTFQPQPKEAITTGVMAMTSAAVELFRVTR